MLGAALQKAEPAAVCKVAWGTVGSRQGLSGAKLSDRKPFLTQGEERLEQV